MTQQLTLNLGRAPEQRFDTFFAGPNAEAVATLRAFADGQFPARSAVVHGPPGCGKSHLLRAAAHTFSLRGLKVWATSPERFNAEAQTLPNDADALVIDGENSTLSPRLEGELFTWYNAHLGNGRVVVALRPPLAGSDIRDDLRTRLAAGIVVRITPLDDASLTVALVTHARARGLPLNESVLQYLVTHFSRDMATLTSIVDGLDALSLSEKRAITVPLLRTLIGKDLS